MNKNYTLKQIADFAQQEKMIRANILDENVEFGGPSKMTLTNILNYSKALSVRKLKSMDTVEMVLN